MVNESSCKIISAAPFATSVPVIPIATPTSAAFNEGASFTPSPVIETIFPLSWNAFTIRTLCSGDTRAKIESVFALSFNSSSDIASNSCPIIHSSGDEAIPSFLAIAKAVSLWSPVIIIVFTPAPLKTRTDSITSGRSGSIIPTIPT